MSNLTDLGDDLKAYSRLHSKLVSGMTARITDINGDNAVLLDEYEKQIVLEILKNRIKLIINEIAEYDQGAMA